MLKMPTLSRRSKLIVAALIIANEIRGVIFVASYLWSTGGHLLPQ